MIHEEIIDASTGVVVRTKLSDEEESKLLLKAAPLLAALIPIQTKFSSKTFFDRFTDEEKLAVVSATLVNIPLKIFYDTMWGVDYVDVTDLETIAGVDALIAATILDASRKDEVLATA